MTVNELIATLKILANAGHGNEEVKFAYPSGDHWRTTLAGEVENADPAEVEHSAYHDTDKVVEDDGRDYEEEDRKVATKTRTVILLTS